MAWAPQPGDDNYQPYGPPPGQPQYPYLASSSRSGLRSCFIFLLVFLGIISLFFFILAGGLIILTTNPNYLAFASLVSLLAGLVTISGAVIILIRHFQSKNGRF